MITNQDRSYYFGASDTKFIVGNWKTKTFEKWFLQKLGFQQPKFDNVYTLAGTHYEHNILQSYSQNKNIYIEKDKQIILEDFRLRVNFDGTTDNEIYEVKTFKSEWKLKKEYIQQCQVQMFAKITKECYVLAYPLNKENYKNFFLDVDFNKIIENKIEYDSDFVNNVYLPRLKILRNCLIKGIFPT